MFDNLRVDSSQTELGQTDTHTINTAPTTIVTIMITLSLLVLFQQGIKDSGTDLGTGYGGTVCGLYTRPCLGYKPEFDFDLNSRIQPHTE